LRPTAIRKKVKTHTVGTKDNKRNKCKNLILYFVIPFINPNKKQTGANEINRNDWQIYSSIGEINQHCEHWKRNIRKM
jgi:hypothetical protein